jgi:uncharacterized membrane protein YbhN (UPF0104 family)
MTALNISSRRSPPAPQLPSAFVAVLSVPLFILVLRFYREWVGSSHSNGSNASPWKIAYAAAVLLIFIPLILAADGCGGAAAIAPAVQKSSIVTPSGASTLVITPTATNASGKALQMLLIQLTLVVN